MTLILSWVSKSNTRLSPKYASRSWTSELVASSMRRNRRPGPPVESVLKRSFSVADVYVIVENIIPVSVVLGDNA
ncbi:uncharacterized protein PHALS_14001 [Plasmopara halstedii]|uniref:Uncharacterized protein n=1 Tax=Plasmopara halstedii TaxID=4781 RepID=A0A0N7L6A2_PLAHL|nr:uncharacterized protein PHALS_14001 [Plasmopara halstedii]CEG43707.1 hypothetical protein PHALS_14001 [Plasmopara halstedii]|eukprot:XP_024580076.1 hypothetical protein PHALS_14001 [Plasmopara halstedii]